MGEGSSQGQKSSFWEESKEFWRARFSYLNKYKKILGRDEPLPLWRDADVEEFIQSDPVYGPQSIGASGCSSDWKWRRCPTSKGNRLILFFSDPPVNCRHNGSLEGQQSLFWEESKEFCHARFLYLNKYKKIFGRDEPLPLWRNVDVEEFIQSDPIYGPQVSHLFHLTSTQMHLL